MDSSKASLSERLPALAIFLTVIASVGLSVVVAGFIVRGTQPTQLERVPSNSGQQDEGIEEILVRLDRLETRLNDSDESGETPNSDSLEQEAEHNRVERNARDLFERLERLEKIEEDRRLAAERQAEARRMQIARMTEAATVVMLDPSADDQMKARAWGQIRMNAANNWTDEIVAEAVRIGSTSTDPQIRADVWRQAHAGRMHPLLLQPLLHALANDSESTAREEAAETLDLYLNEPGVRQALQTASQFDEAPNVRRQASASLVGPRGGF